MPTFTLTAKVAQPRPGGFHIEKGDQFIIHINMAGIHSNNLLTSSRCKEQLIRQFKINGIDLPPTDAIYNSTAVWDVKMSL